MNNFFDKLCLGIEYNLPGIIAVPIIVVLFLINIAIAFVYDAFITLFIPRRWRQ